MLKVIYTKLLKQHDFAKLISIYAKDDEVNSRKSKNEIEFLKSKNVTVVAVEGNHHSMLNTDFMKKSYYRKTIYYRAKNEITTMAISNCLFSLLPKIPEEFSA